MTAWVTQVVGTGTALRGVWGASSSSVYACGDAGTLLRYNGTAWAQESLPGAFAALNFSAIWGVAGSPETVYAATSTGRIARKAGGVWTDLGFPLANGNSVGGLWASSTANLWALQRLGVFQQSVNNGGAFSTIFADGAATAGPIRGFDASDIYAAASVLALYFYNGTSWTKYVQAQTLIDIWPDTASTGYALSAASIFRFSGNGSTGLIAQTLPDANISPAAIFGINAATVYVVGTFSDTGNFRVLKLQGNGVWVDDAVPVFKATPTQVWVDAGGSAFAVTTGGDIMAKAILPLSVLGAVAVATNAVQVTLSAQPLAKAAIGAGDAFNPATWAITRTDTGAAVDVMAIVQVSPTVFNVVIYERFADFHVQYQVAASAMVDPYGGGILNDAATFSGVLADAAATQEARAAARNFVLSDIANPPFPQGPAQLGGGVRVINAAGDFASESGNALLRKLILRRLSTTPGGFFHLPGYGIGLQVKQPIKTNDLTALKKNIQDQVALEPEVAAVNARLFLDPEKNMLTILLQVRTSTGATLDIETQQSTAGQPF